MPNTLDMNSGNLQIYDDFQQKDLDSIFHSTSILENVVEYMLLCENDLWNGGT